MNELTSIYSVALSKPKKMFVLEDPNEMEITKKEFYGFSVKGKLEGFEKKK